LGRQDSNLCISETDPLVLAMPMALAPAIFELPDKRADRAACSRDNNRLAPLRLADEIEPGIFRLAARTRSFAKYS
jgi:hypothetical protein